MIGADTRPEASLTMVVQPRCVRCESPHPLALGVEGDTCPNCGGPASPTRTIEVSDVRINPNG